MLRSVLAAARHVFLDPDPDPAASWKERKRMFALPRYVRAAIAGQARVIADDDPLYLYGT